MITALWVMVAIAVVLGVVLGYAAIRFRVRLAAGIAALAALRLRQHRVDFLHQRVALDAEADRGIAEHNAQHHGNGDHHP